MDDDRILELTSKMEETLGKDNFALVSDTVGEILTGNAENMKAIASRDAEIDKLKDRNEKLVSANGALLQKIPMERSRRDEDDDNSDKKAPSFSLKDAFDDKGNFKH